MATLEKIRTRAGVLISVIIGIALLSFLVHPQDVINWFQASKNKVGEINGHKIDIQKFQKEVDYYTHINQLLNGQSAQTEQMSEQSRNQAWEKLLREYIFDDEYENIGLGISDKELGDLAAGANLSPVIKAIPDFYNSQTGEANWPSIENFWKNPSSDPRQQTLMAYLEDEIRNYGMMSKYVALINKATYVNSLEIKRAKENSANSVEFNYVVERFMGGKEADSLYKVKSSDAKDYYNKHKKRFEQEESRDFDFVAFPVLPSQDDELFAKTSIEKLVPEFAKATDLVQFVQLNSDGGSFDHKYYKQGQLPSVLDAFAFSAGEQMMPPTVDGNMYKMARVSSTRMLPDSVKFRNMLIPVKGTPEATAKLADSVVKVLKNGGDWASLATMYPADAQSAANGGEVGWLSDQQLANSPLYDSCFLNPTGKVMSVPVQTGILIFQVSQKTKDIKKVQLAVVQKEITPSAKTYDETYNKANQLAASAQGGIDAFSKAAQEKSYTKQTATNIMPGSKQVLSITNARPLVQWAYGNDVKKGALSSVIDIDRKMFVVAVLTEVREDGTAPFDQVKDVIGEELRKEMQGEALAAKLKGAGATTLEDLATKLNLSVQPVVNPVTFGMPNSYSAYIPGLGLEPKVTATATTLPEAGKMSEPIIGNSGVYVITITQAKTDEGYSPEMAKVAVLQSQQQQQMDMYSVLLKAGKVKDKRSKFY